MPKDTTLTKVLNEAKRRRRVEAMASELGYESVRAMLHSFYVDKRMSIGNIAAALGMGFSNTRRLLDEHDVPLRDLGERLHNGNVDMTFDLVQEMLRHGVGAVAARLNVDESTVRFHLLKWIACRQPRIGRRPSPRPHILNEATANSEAAASVSEPTIKAPTTTRSTAPVQVEPEIYVRGHRINENDVKDCLRGLGDSALRDYESGALSKSEAYEMTRTWLKEVRSV